MCAPSDTNIGWAIVELLYRDSPTGVFVLAFQSSRSAARAHRCSRCGRHFASQKSLTNHVTTSHRQQVVHEKVVLGDGRVRYKCDLCDGLFSTNQVRQEGGVGAS